MQLELTRPVHEKEETISHDIDFQINKKAGDFVACLAQAADVATGQIHADIGALRLLNRRDEGHNADSKPPVFTRKTLGCNLVSGRKVFE